MYKPTKERRGKKPAVLRFLRLLDFRPEKKKKRISVGLATLLVILL